MKKILFFFLLLTVIACGDDNNSNNPTAPEDNFDRQAMLENWADNIIVPAYVNFVAATTELKNAGNLFASNPNGDHYNNLTAKWEAAYLAFQDVSMFEIGKAEELRLTNNLNVYPTNVDGLRENVLNGGYNLDLPSQVAMQGFPALDYLLYSVSDDVMGFYQNEGDAPKYLEYIGALVHRIDSLAQAVLVDWNDGYRNTFVENSGNSATASVDKLTNDYIFYYEKHLRAGKIGIPAGVFSGDPLPQNVEAFYRKDLSKRLFDRALDAVQDFFNGKAYNGVAEAEGFKTYIDYLQVQKNNQSLATAINNQLNTARTTANGLSNDFASQVETDNVKMLETYDQLQLNVVLLKVDMLQAMNINVDYVDADGD